MSSLMFVRYATRMRTYLSLFHTAIQQTKRIKVGNKGITNEKTGGGYVGGIVEDATIFVRNDKNGQYQE